MRTTIPALVALAALVAACTPTTTAAPPTVTVTAPADKATSDKPADEPTDEGSNGGGSQPCGGAQVEVAVAPGEWPDPTSWQTAVVLTNIGPDACTVEGASELLVYAGGNGSKLPIQQVTNDDGVPPEVVELNPGDQATMALEVPTTSDEPVPSDCLEGGGLVEVMLAGDDKPVSTTASMPPVCGAVHVGSWAKGGAPGVAPN